MSSRTAVAQFANEGEGSAFAFVIQPKWIGRDTLSHRMFNALRYYWIIAKGYRLCPWKSPYIQWRMETFFGHEAAGLDRRKFFHLMWRERDRMRQFLRWVAQRRAAQHAAEHESRSARKHRSE